MSSGFEEEISVSIYPSKFEEKQHFREYHFWKKYDPRDIYPKGSFSNDFGNDHGEHNYKYVLYRIYLIRDTGKGTAKDSTKPEEVQYVVAQEELSKEEQKELAPYCQCTYHSSYFIFKMFIRAANVGCLDTLWPRQKEINNARKKKYASSR